MKYFLFLAMFSFSTHLVSLPLPGDSDFFTLNDGRNLRSLLVKNKPLNLTTGQGKKFADTQKSTYCYIKNKTLTHYQFPIQWTLTNLNTGEIIAQSAYSKMRIFGASVSKLFVAATLLNQTSGKISDTELQLLANMITVSSNTAWTALQKLIGNGDSDEGRRRIINFTDSLGYEHTRGFQGWLGELHGNELSVNDLAQFLYDTYHEKYSGAEILWKIMHTHRTGNTKAKKYLPTSIYVGGKTGTYHGPTVDPHHGHPTRVGVHHHVIAFNHDDTEYGLSILTNLSSSEDVAVLAGGLFREHIQAPSLTYCPKKETK